MFEDQRLFRRLKSGDKDALRLIYEKYIDDLLRVAASLLHDIQAAEDCLHDVFVNFAANANDLNCRNIKKYLIACIANRSRDMLRKEKNMLQYQQQQQTATMVAANPVTKLIIAEQAKIVFDTLPELAYQQREVFVLRVLGGLKFKEIAGMLKISINTAQSRYRYAITKLREVLEQGELK